MMPESRRTSIGYERSVPNRYVRRKNGFRLNKAVLTRCTIPLFEYPVGQIDRLHLLLQIYLGIDLR